MADDKKLILPFDDYMSIGDEGLEKVKEDQDEETKKVLENGLKVADEINGNEHVKAFPVEPKMPKNEKLILKEPEETLNEDLTMSDRDNFTRDLYNAIAEVCFTYNYLDLTREDIEQALEWFELHFFDQFDEDDFYEESLGEDLDALRRKYGKGRIKESEEDLEEALPRDLSKVYMNARNRVGNDQFSGYGYNDIGYRAKQAKSYGRVRRTMIDFQNSDYTEITPEEALALKKAGRAEEIRVIFDGQLVTFDSEGKQRTGNYTAMRSYNSGYDKYTKKSGDVLDSSRKLTFAEVVDKADKIYLANEKIIDSKLRDDRLANPESPFSNISRSNKNLIDTKYTYGQPTVKLGYWDDDPKSALDAVHKLERLIADVKAGVKAGVSTGDLDELENNLAKAKAKYNVIKDQYGRSKDVRKRYMMSEIELQKPFEALKQLKNNVVSSQRALNNAISEYNSMKANGSSEARRYKNRIENCSSRLTELMKEIAEYEILLQDENAAAATKLTSKQAEVDDLRTKLDDVQVEIDKLLRRA